MRFHKYHALGNDYIVMDPADYPNLPQLSPEQIRVICHRNFGVGSDGILWGPLPSSKAGAGRLRIYNPDASEAEKSGNGLRIFCRFLYDTKRVGETPFQVETLGGVVTAEVLQKGAMLKVDMGHVSFHSDRIPVKITGPAREVLNEPVRILDRDFHFCAATVGNPHCIILVDTATPELAKTYGPHLETHPLFPNKTNVQFMQILDRKNIRIEIWERGAAYTLASGSSSSASAAVARRLGLVDSDLTVHMPGGTIAIHIGDDFAIRMTGPVLKVAEGTMHPELFQTQV